MGVTLQTIAIPLLSLACAYAPQRPDQLALKASSDAAARLQEMLDRAHGERDAARLLARKLSVESALLPAFIVADLAHGCATPWLARSMAYGYGAPSTSPLGPTSLATRQWWAPREPFGTIEAGWSCPPGMVWHVCVTTERLLSAGPEPAVAIDWVIESDGSSTRALARAFEPALMPAELDFPLLPWGLDLKWDDHAGHALDQSGRTHTEPWRDEPPILANPDDMFDAFDAIRVHQWITSRMPGTIASPGLGAATSSRPLGTLTIDLDRGPLAWHDPNSFALVRHGPGGDVREPFRPVRLIANLPELSATLEWRSWGPGDWVASGVTPSRVPRRIVIRGDGRDQAIATFGAFELVERGTRTWHSDDPPQWARARALIEQHDAPGLHGLVLAAQDGLGTVQARARMGIELALQALDAAIDAGWSLPELQVMAPDLLRRCLDRLEPYELVQLVLDAVTASRGTISVLAAERLTAHPLAGAEERAWASMALPSLWAWLHDPPVDESPLAGRRLGADRALRPLMLGQRADRESAKGAHP